MDFATLPKGPLRLENVTVPACLLGRNGDLIRTDIRIADGKIAATGGTPIDLKRAMLFPAFVDMHTHLDKGHIWDRAPNPDGTFLGAITTVAADRTANWTAEDVRARMEFGLRCAYAHGTSAIRTHLDSLPPQDSITWPVFEELRAEWAGRIDLQAASLIGCDTHDSIAEGYAATAAIVARAGGILGMVTYPVADLNQRLTDFFDLAGHHGLEADFHSDETLDPSAETLRAIAEMVLDTGWGRPVTVGHCCSLAAQDEARPWRRGRVCRGRGLRPGRRASSNGRR